MQEAATHQWTTRRRRSAPRSLAYLVRGFATLVAVLFCLPTPGSIAPLPEPPEDWAKDIDPRFEPSVEKTIVDFHFRRINREALVDIWEQWGFEAFDRLLFLPEVEGWGVYQRDIASFILAAPHPDMRDYVRELLLDYALPDRDPTWGPKPWGVIRALLDIWCRIEEENAEELASLIATDGAIALREQAVQVLLRLGTDDARKLALERMEEMAEHEELMVRAAALRLASYVVADVAGLLALHHDYGPNNLDKPEASAQLRALIRTAWRAEEAMEKRQGRNCKCP